MSRQKVFFAFLNVLSYLVCVLSFKSINSSFLSRKKKYDGDNFTPSPRKQLRGQKTSVRIGLIKLTELSDILNYKPFFKYCILQTTLLVFLLFIFAWDKIFCSINWAVFFIFLIWIGLAFGVTVLMVLCLWCSFYKVIGN